MKSTHLASFPAAEFPYGNRKKPRTTACPFRQGVPGTVVSGVFLDKRVNTVLKYCKKTGGTLKPALIYSEIISNNSPGISFFKVS